MPNVIMQPTTEGRKPLLLSSSFFFCSLALSAPQSNPPLLVLQVESIDDSSHLPAHGNNPCVDMIMKILSVRSSLPLGCCAGDIGYTWKREEGKDDTVMRDENAVSIRKFSV